MEKTFELGLKFKVAQKNQVRERFLSPFFRDLISFFSAHKMPDNLIMFSVESYLLSEKKCEIIFIVGEDTRHLGRVEEFEKCIFSAYSDKTGDIVLLDNVKNNPDYLALDPRVNSEMFYEHAVDDFLHILVNAEFFSLSTGDEAVKWFEKIVDFIKSIKIK